MEALLVYNAEYTYSYQKSYRRMSVQFFFFTLQGRTQPLSPTNPDIFLELIALTCLKKLLVIQVGQAGKHQNTV